MSWTLKMPTPPLEIVLFTWPALQAAWIVRSATRLANQVRGNQSSISSSGNVGDLVIWDGTGMSSPFVRLLLLNHGQHPPVLASHPCSHHAPCLPAHFVPTHQSSPLTVARRCAPSQTWLSNNNIRRSSSTLLSRSPFLFLFPLSTNQRQGVDVINVFSSFHSHPPPLTTASLI
ncbi:hypothetical protein ACRALDRAFT_208662 [Sodiomyces alcalophilus JCM 7366]|uniref:uncharacterized protein n=1 Tax=Sodiomyces alcalophilus JCM 7366 TaxID=591952 RepID=UPI0039B5B372